MATIETILLPDVGNFDQIPVIEILAQPGDTIEKDQSLLTLETDKATMEIPTPVAGVLVEWLVKLGDKVSKGMPIAKFELATELPSPLAGEGLGERGQEPSGGAAPSNAATPSPQPSPARGEGD